MEIELKLFRLAGVFALISSCAVAQSYTEGSGQTFHATTNENGGILLSPRGEKIYLGNECDVLTSRGVRGVWYWSNAGFAVRLFPDTFLTFDRQDAPVSGGELCRE